MVKKRNKSRISKIIDINSNKWKLQWSKTDCKIIEENQNGVIRPIGREVVFLYFIDRLTMKAIAIHLGLDRKTVRRMIKEDVGKVNKEMLEELKSRAVNVENDNTENKQ
jgi:hypothetical protein